ncbi:MAG: hypothetical protein OXE76_03935 [Alphaproteobacteria bacterium]|nr:hypothetical protein [Alphaproteobacteria bacterium]
MSTKSKDGGSAFPYRFTSEWQDTDVPGLTKREWFAGMALAGVSMPIGELRVGDIEHIADAAYKIADAMLAAREKEDDTA